MAFISPLELPDSKASAVRAFLCDDLGLTKLSEVKELDSGDIDALLALVPKLKKSVRVGSMTAFYLS